jgi:hypothetical protein
MVFHHEQKVTVICSREWLPKTIKGNDYGKHVASSAILVELSLDMYLIDG